MEPEPSAATATPIHTVTLNSTHSTSSKITNINLYTDRAQITRSYHVPLAAGQTKLTLEGLPNVVDHESIRVEGRGKAVIQGVSAFKADFESTSNKTSPLLEELQDKKTKALNALARYQKTINAIDKYMDNISMEHLDISKLGEAMDVYDMTEEKWEDRLVQEGKEVERITELIDVEVRRLKEGEGTGENGNLNKKKLRTKVEMGLYAEEGGDVEVVLIYAVSSASWEAGYDIRVDMQTPNAPVKVVYKAAINQRTGEAWDNVPLTLETAQPTFGLDIPLLTRWNITHQPPSSGRGLGRGGAKRHRRILPDEDDEDYMETQTSYVTSKGRVNATFRVPGLVTVPSDEEEHGVVIADLKLEAGVRWVGVPKGGRKVFLEANITNSSEYTFLPGPGNVYVDQSFISRSDIPGVSPKEVFKCALGVDPSIRVTYHPQEKLISESGFYNKSLRYTFTQRISIHNTKSIAVEGVRMTDNIPVSQDANINVTLVEPALSLPAVGAAGAGKPLSVKVSEGVVAMWKGADELGQGQDVGALGKDGKIDWVCALPAFGRVELVLRWEIGTGVRTEIYGL